MESSGEKMIKRGNTANVAVDRILAVYGRDQSVTNVIIKMKKDNLQHMFYYLQLNRYINTYIQLEHYKLSN